MYVVKEDNRNQDRPYRRSDGPFPGFLWADRLRELMYSERASNVIGKNVAGPYHKKKDEYGDTAVLKMAYRGDYSQRIGHINESEIGISSTRQNFSHLPQTHSNNHQNQGQHADTGCVRRPSVKRSAEICYTKCAD